MNRPVAQQIWRAFFALVVLLVCALAGTRLIDERGRGPLPAGWRVEGEPEIAKRVSGSLWFGHDATLVWALPVAPMPPFLRIELEIDYEWIAQVFLAMTGGDQTFLVYEDVWTQPAGTPFRVFLEIAGGEMTIGDAENNAVWRRGAVSAAVRPELKIRSNGSRMNIRSARALAGPNGPVIAAESFGPAFDVRNVALAAAVFAAIWALAALLDGWFWRRFLGQRPEHVAPSLHRALLALVTVFLLADFALVTRDAGALLLVLLVYRGLSWWLIDRRLLDSSPTGARAWTLPTGLLLFPVLGAIGVALWKLSPEQQTIIFPLCAAGCVAGVTLLHRVRENMKLYGAASLICSLLFLTFVEISLRQPAWDGRFPAQNLGPDYAPHDALFWAPKNLSIDATGKKSEFTLLASRIRFRSGAAAETKAPGVYRVMALGGSNTWGQGFDDSQVAQIWPSRLEAALRAAWPGRQVEVINAGVGGYSLLQLLILYRQYLQSYDVDLILLYVNDNDSAQHYRRGVLTLREIYLARTKENESGAAATEHSSAATNRLVAIRQKLQQFVLFNALAQGVSHLRGEARGASTADEPGAFLKSINPVEDYRANLRELIAAAKARGAQVVLIDEIQNPRRDDALDVGTFFEEAMQQTAAEEGVYFLPAARWFNRLARHTAYFIPWDHVHLNAEGHQLLADMIARFLLEQKLLFN